MDFEFTNTAGRTAVKDAVKAFINAILVSACQEAGYCEAQKFFRLERCLTLDGQLVVTFLQVNPIIQHSVLRICEEQGLFLYSVDDQDVDYMVGL